MVSVECEDFSLFQEALKNLRKTDDIIINTINAVVPTDSFHPDAVGSCKNLHENLKEGNLKRQKLIKNCISATTEQVKKLKEQRELNQDDMRISKTLRAEHTKLRMLHVELNVEDLIQQRTLKVFNEKCKKYYNPL